MFGTSGIRGRVGEAVTGDLALAVGRAVASTGHERVVVGRDVRDSGAMLRDALVAGLCECGADVLTVGVAATPTIARAVDWYDADAGVAITASHNPPADNGIKLWTPSGKAFGPAKRGAIEDCIETGDYDRRPADDLGERTRRADATERHRRALRRAVSFPDGEAPSVVVDVGNGTGRITADALADLGCDVRTLHGQPDGRFPGRPSEPNEETLGDLQALVGRTDAALGVAHDGDADRTMAVDETGAFVPKDALLALLAREAVREATGSGAGTDAGAYGRDDSDVRVAAPVDTSLAVEDALAEAGATVEHTRVGDVYVAERATEPGVVFGGEPSGAWIWPDETLCPDGPLAACKLAALVADRGPLSDLVADVPSYPIRRTSIEVADKRTVVERVGERLRAEYGAAAIDDRDGVRVDAGDGWLLVRASGTEPVVRITAEARDADRAGALSERATTLVADAAGGV